MGALEVIPLAGKRGIGATSTGGCSKMVSIPAGGGMNSVGGGFWGVFSFSMLEKEENTEVKFEDWGRDVSGSFGNVCS